MVQACGQACPGNTEEGAREVSAREECPYFWHSHGCDLDADHEGDHVCDHSGTEFENSTRPRGHVDVWRFGPDSTTVYEDGHVEQPIREIFPQEKV